MAGVRAEARLSPSEPRNRERAWQRRQQLSVDAADGKPYTAAIAGIVAGVLIAAGAWILRPVLPPAILNLSITPPEGASLAMQGFDLSPDGRQIGDLSRGRRRATQASASIRRVLRRLRTVRRALQGQAARFTRQQLTRSELAKNPWGAFRQRAAQPRATLGLRTDKCGHFLETFAPERSSETSLELVRREPLLHAGVLHRPLSDV